MLMIDELDENYWSQKYQNQHTEWDMGHVSPPIQFYIEQITNKNLTILIPGSGNAYEASFLYKKGFENTFILDISSEPLHKFKNNNPEFPENQVLHQDFFLFEGLFDLILEQTFFCALHPNLRPQYVEKMLSLLRSGGKLVGVLFDDPLFHDHPPFGGNKEEYLAYFQPFFKIITFERCYNSIAARQNRELFMILQLPKT
ncbi:class I SAM-dependent methyltransferase [Catalinimonas niigatensis]|uniref:SAM-dependent methyltransferase n=1 Tax=Catalinimonas niigatensis TaxID=1397264 RepID=UPI002AA2A49B|nr:SAM-dependent methyltransferase [Catalinimonas niigatensis]WPP50257.1 SAM-dependent methyltransferase [Catalinimonas niigatensis]